MMTNREKKNGIIYVLNDNLEEMAEKMYLAIYRAIHQDSSKTTSRTTDSASLANSNKSSEE